MRDAVRTRGIAGELVTAPELADENQLAKRSGRRRVDGVRRSQKGCRYQKSSSLRPCINGWRLICALMQGHEAPQATKNQMGQNCCQGARLFEMVVSAGSANSLCEGAVGMVFRGVVRKTSTH